jgi:hypothetical protein
MTKKVGYKRIMSFASIGVFPLIIMSPIDTDMRHLFLGRGGVFFLGQFFLGMVLWQRPVSNNREVFSLGSVLRARCHGKIVLLVQPKMQEGEVGRSRHA